MRTSALCILTLALGSCTVYAPMQCAAPNLRDQGELEVSATVNANSRLEGAAAYSPVKHVLVRAAGSFKNDADDTTYFRVRQFEVAAGAYLTPSEAVTIGALGGYGRAHNHRGFLATGGLFDPQFPTDRRRQFDGRYHTVFGEVYASYQGRHLGGGGAIRLTDVRFDELTDRGIPFGPASMLRFEPMGYVRFMPFDRFDFLQFQVAAGFSVTLSNQAAGDANTEHIRQGSTRLAGTIMLYPHRLWQK